MTAFQEKLILVLVDKALIGMLLMVAGFWLNRYLEVFRNNLARENEVRRARDQAEREQTNRSREELLKLRTAFDNNSDLASIVGLLRREKDGVGFEPMAGTEMRKLPAFLEDVAQRWRFQFVSLSDVDAVFGDEVMLCDTSLAMWQDESEPKSDVFWGTFNRLAAALRHHHADVR